MRNRKAGIILRQNRSNLYLELFTAYRFRWKDGLSAHDGLIVTLMLCILSFKDTPNYKNTIELVSRTKE